MGLPAAVPCLVQGAFGHAGEARFHLLQARDGGVHEFMAA
jgi:hypothetical protein